MLSPFTAASTPERHQDTLRALMRLVTLLCCSLLSVFGSAQTLQLSKATPTAGERVTVTGQGLAPGTQVTAQLTAPGGRVDRESARVADDGAASLNFTLPTGGRYQLLVRGGGVERTWQLVVPRPSATAAPPRAPQTGTQSLTPGANPATAATLRVTRVGKGVSAAQGNTRLWSLTFPENSGTTTQPLFENQTLYLGHGNSVLQLEPKTGVILARFLVSGPVARLESTGDAAVAVTVRHSDTLLERFTLRGGALQEPVVFGTDPRTFAYLRDEAAVADPAVRLGRDPTNPWLYLNVGLEQQPDAAQATFRKAIGAATTFYDLAGLATVFEDRGERELAAEAFTSALGDFAARGYDPRLLTDGALEAAYTFPLRPLERALREDDDLSAGFWAPRLWLAAPQVPGAAAAFAAYAELLQQLGTPDEAELWAGRAAQNAAPGGGLEHLGLTLARSGWQLVPALIAAFLALHLTLLAKYARGRRSNPTGSRVPWLFALRFYTFSEKLVLLALLTLTLVSAALGSWADRGEPPRQIIGSGTLSNRAAQAYLGKTAFSGPQAAFVRGTAQAAAGDAAAARQSFEAAGNSAPALNNLGVLTGDHTFFSRALALEPNLPAARYNTGDRALLPFQQAYKPGSPTLALPTPSDFQLASGNLQSALSEAFTNPQRALSAPPYSLSLVLWRVVQLLFLLAVFVHAVFLFVPRPRSAHGAPRGPVYHLFAVLFPGTGLADELWGIFLLVPWAIFGAGAFSAFGSKVSSPLTLALILAGIYLVNTAAVIVESFSNRLQQRGSLPNYRARTFRRREPRA